MGEQELFTLTVAIAVVVIIGRAVATRLEVPEAVVFVVLGVLASLIPQVPNIDLSPDVVLVLFLPPLVYNAAFTVFGGFAPTVLTWFTAVSGGSVVAPAWYVMAAAAVALAAIPFL